MPHDIGRLLESACSVFEPLANRSLTREDAREITANLTGFFGVLADWALAEKRSPETVVLTQPPEEPLGGLPSVPDGGRSSTG